MPHLVRFEDSLAPYKKLEDGVSEGDCFSGVMRTRLDGGLLIARKIRVNVMAT